MFIYTRKTKTLILNSGTSKTSLLHYLSVKVNESEHISRVKVLTTAVEMLFYRNLYHRQPLFRIFLVPCSVNV